MLALCMMPNVSNTDILGEYSAVRRAEVLCVDESIIVAVITEPFYTYTSKVEFLNGMLKDMNARYPGYQILITSDISVFSCIERYNRNGIDDSAARLKIKARAEARRSV